MAAGSFNVVISAVDNATATIDKINKKLAGFQKTNPFAQLTASATNFQNALKKTMELSGVNRMTRSFTSLRERIKDVSTGVQAIGTHLKSVIGSLGLIGAFSVAGLGKMLTGTGAFSKNINNMAARTGLKTDDIQAYRNAAEIKLGSGGAEVMDSTMEAVGQTSQDIANGRASPEVMRLAQLSGYKKGQAQAGFTGEQATEFLMQAADRGKEIKDAQGGDPRAAIKYFESLNIPSKMAPMLMNGSADFKKQIDQGRQNVLNPAQLLAAEQFNESITKLTQSMTNFGETIAAGVSPKLSELVDRFNAWTKSSDGQQFIQQIIDWLNRLIDTIGKVNWQQVGQGIVAFKDDVVAVAKVIDAVVTSVMSWKTAIEVMIAAWALFKVASVVAGIISITSAIAEMVAAITGVTTAIGLMSAAWVAIPAGMLAYLAKLGSDHETPETQKKREENRREIGGQSPTNMSPSDGYNVDGTSVSSDASQPSSSAPGPRRQQPLTPSLPAQAESPIPPISWQPPSPIPAPLANFPPPGPRRGPEQITHMGDIGSSFTSKAPVVMANLMKDFNLTKEQAAGIVGNLGHESAGLQAGIQEQGAAPGKGGIGWAQWTGPRRREFESWTASNKLDPKSDDANYGFLKHELLTTQSGSIEAVKKQNDPSAAMLAFEKSFEKAGVKSYASRSRFTDQAMQLPLPGQPQTQIAQAPSPPKLPSFVAKAEAAEPPKQVVLPPAAKEPDVAVLPAPSVPQMPAVPSVTVNAPAPPPLPAMPPAPEVKVPPIAVPPAQTDVPNFDKGVQSMTIRPEKQLAPDAPKINVPAQVAPKVVLPDQQAPETIQASPINYQPPSIFFSPRTDGPQLDPSGFNSQRSDNVPSIANPDQATQSKGDRDGKLHVTIQHDGVGKVTAKGSGNVLGSAPRVTSAMPAFASA